MKRLDARVQRWLAIALIGALAVVVSVAVRGGSAPTAPLTGGAGAPQTSMPRTPVAFEVNQGQFDPSVLYVARQGASTVWITRTGMVTELTQQTGDCGKTAAAARLSGQATTACRVHTSAVRLSYVGENANPTVTASDPLPGEVNYLIGTNPKDWHTKVPTFGSVTLRNVYAGIDLTFHGNAGQVEHDWTVHPGAKPSDIAVKAEWATPITDPKTGAMVFSTGGDNIILGKPSLYQSFGGRRTNISGGFSASLGDSFGYDVGPYDHRSDLVIDPSLTYSTYLGGTGGDDGTAIALDQSGDAYITGFAGSTNFPTVNPIQSTTWGNGDAFVTEINAAGTALVYSTYLGGTGEFGDGDSGSGIAVDSAGDAYVTGTTYSENFPTVTPLQSANGCAATGCPNAFVAELSAGGSSLVYSTYLGGGGAGQVGGSGDGGSAIAVDGSGNAYVTGATTSPNFPTHNPLQATYGGDGNAFVTKIAAGGTALTYSTYLGGSGGDGGTAIAVDSSGDAYVTGSTSSTDFPMKNALQTAKGPNTAAFVSEITPSGTALVYSTYLGGTDGSGTNGTGIAVDNSGDAFVTGWTASADFPTKNPLQAALDPWASAFLTEISTDGTGLVYSTYLGGEVDDAGGTVGIALDSSGDAYIAGTTAAPDFPVVDPVQATNAAAANGQTNAFVMEVSTGGTGVVYSSYLGGSGHAGTSYLGDYGTAIAVDSLGDAYLTGEANSDDFPTENPIQPTNNGSSDAFVAEIGPASAADALLASEGFGTSNPSEIAPHACGGDPVNCATGNFSEAYTDLAISGRGPALALGRTYNSQGATVEGLLGYGWSLSYGMKLTVNGSTGGVTVSQENGATVSLAPSGAGYTAPSRVLATLVKNANGTYTFTRRQRETLTFSSTGQLLAIGDLNGDTTTLSYNGSGQLVTITDPAGRTITLGYGSNGLISTATDPLGRVVHYGYDGAGDLTAVTDPSGSETQYGYDSAHELATITRPNGGVLTNTYTAGQVTKQVDPMGRVTTYSYVNGTTTLTDPLGNVSVETFSPQGLLLTRTLGSGTPSAATWRYTYDPRTWGSASVTDPNDHTTRATYDARGDALTMTDALQRTATSTYDALGDVLTTTDPANVTTTMAHDAHGNLTRSSTPLVGSSQARVVTYQHTDATHPGDVTAITDPDGNTTTFAYDAAGDLVRATDALGDATTYGYNAIGWLTSLTSPLGNVNGGNPAQHTSTTTYDGVGDVLTSTDAAGDTTSNVFDGDHNLVKQTDPNGHATVYRYDLADEQIEIDQADGSVLKTSYKADGQTATQTDGLGEVTTYAYTDPADPAAVTASTDPLKRTTTYGYDGAGNETSISDPLSRTTTLGYDAANELTSITYSDGVTPDVAYQYDADGRRTAMTDGTGTSTYTYDSLGGLTESIESTGSLQSGGSSLIGNSVGYIYDLAGQVTGLSYPPLVPGAGSAETVARGYDAAGRMTSITDWLGNTTKFGYDADGNMTSETLPNGVSTSLSYDHADRLTQQVGSGPTGTILNLPYTLDADGQLTSANATGITPGVTQTYSYDASNRVTSTAVPLGTTTVSSSAYTYDAANNLTGITTGGLLATTLSYDVADELTSTTNTTTGQKTTFGYDPDGNRVSRTAPQGGTTYGYDEANRLVSYAGPVVNELKGAAGSAGQTVQLQYSYNGDGLRMGEGTAGTAAPTYLWDLADGAPLLLRDTATSYVTDPLGLPLEQIQQGGTVLYYLHDQLGSTRALTNSLGTVVGTYLYDAYGNSIGTLPSVINPFQYAGQYKDMETGLYDMQARYYDPTTGQFLSRDPMVAVTRSPYGYVADNPLNGTDPSGMCGADIFQSCDPRCPDSVQPLGPWQCQAAIGFVSTDQSLVQTGPFQYANGTANMLSGGLASAAEGALGAPPDQCNPSYQAGEFFGAVGGVVLGVLGDPEADAGAASLGSTGRTVPESLTEQLAMEEAQANPLAGKRLLNVEMGDSRWPATQGWIKMEQKINGVTIHYVYNTRTGMFDDFKFAG